MWGSAVERTLPRCSLSDCISHTLLKPKAFVEFDSATQAETEGGFTSPAYTLATHMSIQINQSFEKNIEAEMSF